MRITCPICAGNGTLWVASEDPERGWEYGCGTCLGSGAAYISPAPAAREVA